MPVASMCCARALTAATVAPGRRRYAHDVDAPETIVCVDCGGVCHLLSVMDRDAEHPEGETVIAVYRCEDCLDRWDMELATDED